MLTIRTSKFNTTITKPSSALFLWFHNSKGWFVGLYELICALASTLDRLRASRKLSFDNCLEDA